MAKAKKYVLYGCPANLSQIDETEQGYVGKLSNRSVGLVIDRSAAIVYTDDKEPGHGTPSDWVALFKEDYGLNVHPVYLNDRLTRN